MNWILTLATLLQQEPLLVEDLSLALFARGMCALEKHETIAEDAKLRALEHAFLMSAALYPGPEVIFSRLKLVEATLQDVDDVIARQAEHSLAEVLNTRDRWHVRALGLKAAALNSLAASVEAVVARFDTLLHSKLQSLSAITWMREEASATSWDPSDTAWSQVPSSAEAEPQRHPEVSERRWVPSDEELLLVAQEQAEPALERRVFEAVERDAQLQAHYEELLADLKAFEQASRNVIHLSARKLLSRVPVAQRRPERAVAATTATEQYETPEVDALVFTFQDGSELYAQRDGQRWVLFLSREALHEQDGFSGPDLEPSDHGHLLIARMSHGEARVHYGETTVQLTLEPLET